MVAKLKALVPAFKHDGKTILLKALLLDGMTVDHGHISIVRPAKCNVTITIVIIEVFRES